MSATARESRFVVSDRAGEVTSLLMKPRGADRLLVLGHGAGAGMRHAFMETLAEQLAARGIATFRYQFPYMEQGRRSPSPQPVLLATIRAAVAAARKAAPKPALFAGGKSMGGRMTSLAAAKEPLEDVAGLAFFGFPLHQPGKPSSDRGGHLAGVKVPMLFLQGTRDSLAALDPIRPVCKKLGRRARLHIVEGGDHSFRVPKRSGRTDEEAMEEIVQAFDEWSAKPE